MPKQSNKQSLQDALASRNPLQRQAVTPVNILAPEQTGTPRREGQPKAPKEKTVRKLRTERPSGNSERRTERKGARTSELENRSILADTKRITSRESFEVFADQMDAIEQLQARYLKKNGKPLTKSRVVREALDIFLPMAFETFKEE